ncbi:LysR family transcriptional regulator [Croceibacterium sp. TMG7-5b_MA50]|uniref:LysR family transcriptional regulator n=1 Tax=Croceibacterium sp. TMG7-5b_MA50 TaxID=3121290 RepID=UPI0032215554
MRFKGLDLNLLLLLSVLLEERNVSRTAERLNLSQPAASAALARLREFFGDPLMTVVGKRMIPTALAEDLRPLVRQLLHDAELLVGTSSGFDPASSQRRFRIGASDYIVAVLVSPLLREIEQIAPRLAIEVFPTGREVFAMLERGELDLVIGPEPYLSPLAPSELLFEEEHVAVGWSGNSRMQEPLDEQTFFDLGHLAVRIGFGRDMSFAESQMLPWRDRRRVEATASNFSSVPWMIVETQRIAVLQRRFALASSRYLPLTIQPLPIAMPALVEKIQYHGTRKTDAGLKWLISTLHKISDSTAF